MINDTSFIIVDNNYYFIGNANSSFMNFSFNINHSLTKNFMIVKGFTLTLNNV